MALSAESPAQQASTMNRMIRRLVLPIGITIAASAGMTDEAGVSFWLPGNFGRLASVPGDADWSLPVICCHSKADEDAEKSFVNGGRIVAGGSGGDLRGPSNRSRRCQY